MANTSGRLSGYGGNTLLALLVAVVVVVAVSFLLLSMITAEKVERVRLGWERDLGSWDEILERFPSRGPNAPALRLEALTVPLGIELATRGVEDRDRPVKGKSKSFRRLKGEIGDYLKRQLERPERGPAAPPPEVAAYFDAHRSDIEAVRRQLVGGSLPEWERELEKLWAARIPNLLGHLDLQRLLLADALARESAGDHDTALAGVEAAWRLNSALRDDPTLITQLISISATRMQAGVLRQLGDVPWAWHRRLLAEHDFRDSLISALRFESWMWTQIDPAQIDSSESLPRMALLKVAKPYVQFCFADVSDDFRERLVKLARVRTLCDRDLARSEADLDVPIPSWNLFGDAFVPNLGGALDRLARLELDMELTAKLIELHAARRANGGAWPAELPGIERSDVCPKDHWLYEARSGDSMSVAFSREISWPGQQGAILPMRHVSRM